MPQPPSPFFPLAADAAMHRRTTGDKLPEVTALLRDHFSPNLLRVLGPASAFHADLRTAACGAMRLSTLSYGTEVELQVETADDHLLITTQLRGAESVTSQGQHDAGQVGFVVVDSTPARVTKRFSADSHRLNLRLDRSALEALWQRAVDRDLRAPRVFAPFIVGEAGRRRWWSHLRLLLDYVDAPSDDAAGRRTTTRIEEAVMLYLLLEHPHDASHALERSVLPASDRRVARAEEFIRDHLRDALCLADVAAAAGLGIRSLTAAFRDRHELSPMKYVEQLRLDAAHDALLHGERTVTDVATEWGFSNAGRFAAAYRGRYGDLPSRTVARSRSSRGSSRR